MKSSWLFFLLSIAFLQANAQEEKQVDVNKLVEIIDKSDFNSLVKLVSSLHYVVADSSRKKDGSFFFYSKEPKFHGNILACGIDTKSVMIELPTIHSTLTKMHGLKTN